MAKKRKKGFEERHPFVFLATLPVSLPLAVASDMKKQKKGAAKKKKTATKKSIFGDTKIPKRPARIPKDVKDMNGYEFEEYVARRLTTAGYSNVDVTPKSGDYGADILAKSNGRKVCIQCKKYSKPVGIEAIQEVLGAKAYYNCDVGVVVSTAGFTDAAVNLASAAGIILMSADRIKKV